MSDSNFIQKAIKHPGAFTAKAKAHGNTVPQEIARDTAPGADVSAQTKRQAVLARTLRGFNH